MGKKIDWAKIRRVLEDADMYEEHLPKEVLMQYYNAINNSKQLQHIDNDKSKNCNNGTEETLSDTAEELVEAMKNADSVLFSSSRDDSCHAKDDWETTMDHIKRDANSPNEHIPVAFVENHFSSIVNKNESSPQAIDQRFFYKLDDFPASQPNQLEVIEPPSLPNFSLINDDQFIDAHCENRIEMLCHYFKSFANMCATYFHKSTHRRDPCIITAPICTEMVNSNVTNSKLEELKKQDGKVYVTQFGRKTRRMNYYNMCEVSKSESLKRKKPTEDSIQKRDLETPRKRLNDSFGEVNANNLATDTKDGETVLINNGTDNCCDNSSSSLKEELLRTTPVKPDLELSKLIPAEEIVNRCRLYTESLPSQSAADPLHIDVNDTEHKVEQKNGNDVTKLEGLRHFAFSEATSSNHGKKRAHEIDAENLNSNAKKFHVNKEDEIEVGDIYFGWRSLSKFEGVSDISPTKPSTSDTLEHIALATCPLCLADFPQEQIELHASRCGEDPFATTSKAIPNR